MKKLLKSSLVALILVIQLFNIPAKASNDVSLWINGKYVKSDVSPIVENNRTLVPIRVLSESLGYKVEWDPKYNNITVVKFNESQKIFTNLFVLTIDSNTVLNFKADNLNTLFINPGSNDNFNGIVKNSAQKIEMDVTPKIVNNRTYVPVRVVSELMGEKVEWDNKSNTVVVGNYVDYASQKIASR